MRETLLNETTLPNMVHMPYLGKGGTCMGINFGTAATIFKHKHNDEFKGSFMCIRYYETDDLGVPLNFPKSMSVTELPQPPTSGKFPAHRLHIG